MTADEAEGTRVRRRFAMPAGPSRQLIAASLIVVLLIAAAGAFLALQHFVSTPSTVWGGCGGDFQCTTVKVPLDYSNPGAGSIDLAVIRKPATDGTHRIGSLLFAGPAAGVDYMRNNSVYYGSFNNRFDLVAFDQRGFGRSAPVRCLTDAQIDALNEVDTVLDDPREQQVFIQADQALAQACQQGSSGRMLPFVDTASAARDVDAIRVALGESTITFFGYGYGTFLGQTYAHLYPTHLRALALDGVVDRATTATEKWRLRAAGYEASLQAFLADCRVLPDCPLAQSGDPADRLTRLMQSVDKNPLRVGTRALSRSLAIAGLMFGLDPHMWTRLADVLNDAAGGDGSGLLGFADQFYGRNSDGTYAIHPEPYTAQLCVDRPGPRRRDPRQARCPRPARRRRCWSAARTTPTTRSPTRKR